MSHRHAFVPVLAAALAGAVAAQDRAAVPPAAAALAKAEARAQVHNKRVLAVLCAAGEDFAAVLQKDPALARKLLYEFETVPIAGEEADALAATWQFPEATQEKPALVVLAADGKVLARLPRSACTTATGPDGKQLLALLEPHFCAPVDANEKLKAALAVAGKTGRNVFIRFDAPW